MKFKNNFAPFAFVFLIIYMAACSGKDRQVVPYDLDQDEIMQPLAPNEEDAPEGISFGPDSIPGITIDLDITTQYPEVFIFFEKFTLLDINPKINTEIFNFIVEELKENDFLENSFSLPINNFTTLISDSISYSDVAISLLASIKPGFEAQLKNFDPVYPPYQAYFLIYPVFLNENYVTFRQFLSTYTGGAHGMAFSYLKTYDLNTGELLTLKDIVKPEGMEDVRQEVAAHMAYSYPIYENITTVEQYIDSLNVWLDHSDPLDITGEITLKDYPLTNPAILKEGLAFIYQMYDLTPGSDGCPLVVIPYRDIRGCLFSPFEK